MHVHPHGCTPNGHNHAQQRADGWRRAASTTRRSLAPAQARSPAAPGARRCRRRHRRLRARCQTLLQQLLLLQPPLAPLQPPPPPRRPPSRASVRPGGARQRSAGPTGPPASATCRSAAVQAPHARLAGSGSEAQQAPSQARTCLNMVGMHTTLCVAAPCSHHVGWPHACTCWRALRVHVVVGTSMRICEHAAPVLAMHPVGRLSPVLA